MSLSTAALALGAGFTVFGGFKYHTSNQKSGEEVNKQKRIALACMAVGVVAIAVGVASMGLGTEAAAPLAKIKEAVKKTTFSDIVEEGNCPINKLKAILVYGGNDSTTARAFKVLNETQGISCDNYLAWQDKFHRGATGYVDGIRPTDLQKAIQWGIDQWNRPYIAIKYACDKTIGAVALFQRYTDQAYSVASGGHFEAPCRLGDVINTHGYPNLNYEQFLGRLTVLFKGENFEQFIEKSREFSLQA